MQIFVSTTSLGPGSTNLNDVLSSLSNLEIDGYELGSTHTWHASIVNDLEKFELSRILTHNYFPPEESNLVINLASRDNTLRNNSISHVKHCIDTAKKIGAELYTVHPGFLKDVVASSSIPSDETAYDFIFSGIASEYEDAYERMIESIKCLSDYSLAQGVKLAIETEGSITNSNTLLMEQPWEFRRFFKDLSATSIYLNFNLAHSYISSIKHSFDLKDFILEFREKFAAVEISHNDGVRDLHMPLVNGSYIFDWLKYLPDVPLILEFRNASIYEIQNSIDLLKDECIKLSNGKK